MHELGICADLAEAVLRRAGGRQVRRVRVRAGAAHRIVPEALQESFDLVAEGTVAAGAVVDLEVTPVRWTCRDCGHTGRSTDPYTTCGHCGGVDVEVTGGDELTLVSVSLRAPVAGPAPP